ncbi:DUF2840 domain-containing protein [Nisaea sp.]|uniref:DUF2840 domain-containing protein n=1 Tax=Nisaea sp. TaxID=2024842 RepID=UPI0032649C11
MIENPLRIRETFAEGRRNIWVMGGYVEEGAEIENIPGFRRRLMLADPKKTALIQRWAANEYGTVLSEIIAFTGGGTAFIPEIDKQVAILMYLRTWDVCSRFMPVYDGIKETGVWPLLTPRWWRLCDIRLNAGQPAPPITRDFIEQCA